MKCSFEFEAFRSNNRWIVVLAMASLVFIVSCTTVSNQVDRYESNYQQEYGAAIQDQNNPGLIHYEDEYVLMNLMLQPKAAMAFQILNKTGGSITIVWANVMYDVPRTGLIEAIPSGSLTSDPAPTGDPEQVLAQPAPVSFPGGLRGVGEIGQRDTVCLSAIHGAHAHPDGCNGGDKGLSLCVHVSSRRGYVFRGLQPGGRIGKRPAVLCGERWRGIDALFRQQGI
jgi:hypothetical protein